MPLYNPPAASSAGAPFFETKSGCYFTAPTNGLNTASVGVGYVTVHPLLIPAAVTVDRIAMEVTTGIATALYRLGIYNDDGTMRPGSLLVDAGTLDASTTGGKEITISQALSAGIYWLAAVQQTAGASARSLGVTMPIPVSNLSAAAGNIISGFANNGGTTGALPDPFPTPTFNQTSANTVRVLLRAA